MNRTQLSQLAVLAIVADARSFRKAAAELGMRLMRAAAMDGAGLAYVFDQRVADDIDAGRLIPVLEDWCPPFDGFSIYYPTRRQVRPALRAFVDFFRYRGQA